MKMKQYKKKIERLEKKQKNSEVKRTSESKGAELILDIIDNCLNNFDELDLKMKRIY